MSELGKMLVAVAAVLLVVGALLWTGVGRGWLGRLPGDITVSGEKVRFYFPIVTCLLVSVVLSALLWFFRRF